MVWHILKKDWNLLWQMVVAVALLHVLQLVIDSADIAQRQGIPFSSVIRPLSVISVAVLVVAAVQTDAIPGLRQDWLVRPIRRTDLMLSKILFIVLLIEGPIFIADFCGGLATGFPAGLALHAAFAQNFRLLFALLLPVLAFATLTRNLTETLAGILAIALSAVLFMTLVVGTADMMNSPVWWISEVIRFACILAGAAIILWLQYYGRKTVRSRWVCGITFWSP
jgi:hypothetical protein